MKKIIIIPILLVATATVALAGCQSKTENTSPTGTSFTPSSTTQGAGSADMVLDLGGRVAYCTGNIVTVNSSETVKVTPDIAQVVYCVRTQAKDASVCQQENTQSVSSVIAKLKELGVEERSIQTSDYYMNPVYNYSGNTARVTGYEATATLTVSDLPIDSLDEIFAKSVDEGVNSIQSITYMASNYDESYQEALQKAVSAAYQKAQVLASASGRNVGNALNITETSGYTNARYQDSNARNSMKYSYEQQSLMDSTSILGGEIGVDASVVIEYQLY